MPWNNYMWSLDQQDIVLDAKITIQPQLIGEILQISDFVAAILNLCKLDHVPIV